MIMEGFRVKLLYTAVVYFLFLQLALRFGVYGPTYLDIQDNLGITYNEMSNAFAVMCVGICIGSIMSGFFSIFMSIEMSNFILMLTTAALVASITYLESYFLYVVWCLMVGITSGAAISMCEAWILEIWGNQCGPYMQALQFFRGLGYIIGPVMTEPFLDKTNDLDNHINENNATTNAITNSITYALSTVSTNATVIHRPYNSRIRIPYVLNSIMIFAGACFCIGLYQFRKYQEKHHKSEQIKIPTQTTNGKTISTITTDSTKNKFETVVIESKDNKQHLIVDETRVKYFGYGIVFLSSIFYLFFYEEVIVTFLPSFATKLSIHLTKSQASILTSAFSISNVVGKAISILLALKMSHIKMLYMNITIMILSLIVLIQYADNNLYVLWIFICIHGLGLSNIIASLYTLMEDSIQMSPLVCGILNMSGTSGSVISPLIIGQFMEEQPLILLYVFLVCAIACLIILTIMYLMVRYKDRLISKPFEYAAATDNSNTSSKLAYSNKLESTNSG